MRAFDTPLTGGLEVCDLIHLHWVSLTVDYRSFFASVPHELPIVWTLHDMQPVTGGCHHADDCDGFRHRCGNCPILSRPSPRDLSFRDHGIKKHALRNRRVHVVTPSEWLEKLARASGVFSSECTFRTIHNGISLEQFFPTDKLQARRQLGLPASGLIVAYGAESLRAEAKGIREFLEALSLVQERHPVTGLLFGKDEPPAGVTAVPMRNLGFLTDPEKLRTAYSAADIFALPSHAETISQTAVEALACGTPVVAFDVGGVPEVVRHNETGLLVPLRDVRGLAGAMQMLAENPALRARFTVAGEKLVRTEFEIKRQVQRYRDFYETVCASPASRSSHCPA